MTAPIEVVVDALVLRGVREADAPAVVAAFTRHLSALLRGYAVEDVPAATTPVPGNEQPQPVDEPAADRLGRALAAATHRSVRW